MGLFEKDYLLRQLEQLTKMIAQIVAHLTGGRSGEALQEIQAARQALAGPLAGSLDRLDGPSIVALLGTEKARVYVELAKLESQAWAAQGNDAAARRATERAESVERAI